MRVERATAPASDAVTLADVKAQLRIDHDVEDAYLKSLVAMATDEAQRMCERQFVSCHHRLYLDAWPADGRIWLPYGQVTELVTVGYYPKGTTSMVALDVADFQFVPGDYACVILPSGSSWPNDELRDADGVVVEFDAGWANAAAVPPLIRQGIISLVERKYTHADNERATQGTRTVGEMIEDAVQRSLALHGRPGWRAWAQR